MFFSWRTVIIIYIWKESMTEKRLRNPAPDEEPKPPNHIEHVIVYVYHMSCAQLFDIFLNLQLFCRLLRTLGFWHGV